MLILLISEVEGKTGKSCSVFVSCVTCVRSCARVIPCAWPLRRTRVLLLLLGWAPVVSRGVSCLMVSRGVSCLMVSRVSWCLVGPGGVSWCLNLPQPPYHPEAPLWKNTSIIDIPAPLVCSHWVTFSAESPIPARLDSRPTGCRVRGLSG